MPIQKAANAFRMNGLPIACRPIGNGHINTTFKVDIGNNHFVYGNKKEIEEYKAIRESGKKVKSITILDPDASEEDKKKLEEQEIIPDNFDIPMCCHESEIDADAKVIIYAGGVGEPGHSTDYVCAVKSLEHSCDIYFAKFGCDGVYDRDPNGKDGANAVFYPEVSFARIEAEGLKVIDLEAAQLLQKPASDGELCRGYIFALTAENISAMLCGKADDLRKTVLA